MSRTSLVLMGDTTNKVSYTGDPIRGDGFYGFTDGNHTISIVYNNFTGRIYIEGSLMAEPTSEDWFPIYLTPGVPYLYMEQATGSRAYTFEGNFVYIRARLDRSYMAVQPVSADDIGMLGVIKKIMLNH